MVTDIKYTTKLATDLSLIWCQIGTEWAKNGTKFLYANNFIKYNPILKIFKMSESGEHL